jgi:oligopeptide/dipeptide ABC transporter ATP-binding protein
MADRLVVMYLGKVVEEGPLLEVYNNPLHPYTRLLLESIPKPGERKDRLAVIEGAVPDPFSRPPGCPFEPRCDRAFDSMCPRYRPALMEIQPGHRARCFLHGTQMEEGDGNDRRE